MGQMPDDVQLAAESGERDSPYFWVAVLRGDRAVDDGASVS